MPIVLMTTTGTYTFQVPTGTYTFQVPYISPGPSDVGSGELGPPKADELYYISFIRGDSMGSTVARPQDANKIEMKISQLQNTANTNRYANILRPDHLSIEDSALGRYDKVRRKNGVC